MSDVSISARPRLPIWASLKAGYRLGIGSFFGLREATVVTIILELVVEWFRPSAPLDTVTTTAVSDLCNVLEATVLAPYAVLIHRRIILNEPDRNYLAVAMSTRTVRFACVAIGLAVLGAAANLLRSTYPNREVSVGGGLILVIWGIALVYISVRLSLAFPAIAVDGSSNPIAESWRTNSGSLWRLFWLFMIAILPLFPFAAIVSVDESVTVRATGRAIFATLSTALYVALASHLYRTRAAWSRAPV